MTLPVLDRPFSWAPDSSHDPISSDSSPIGLAISTILSLVPLAEDQYYTQESSTTTRRHYSQLLAKRTIDAIESDSELPDSSFSPAKALLHDRSSLPRKAFHPQVPIELESIIALCILSVYEVIYSARRC